MRPRANKRPVPFQYQIRRQSVRGKARAAKLVMVGIYQTQQQPSNRHASCLRGGTLFWAIAKGRISRQGIHRMTMDPFACACIESKIPTIPSCATEIHGCNHDHNHNRNPYKTQVNLPNRQLITGTGLLDTPGSMTSCSQPLASCITHRQLQTY